MRLQSVVDDAREVQQATALIRLGARLQVLEAETRLSRERLLKLYKEIVGRSPPKGMLPFSTDWFVTWMPNIHASLLCNLHLRLGAGAKGSRADRLVRSYRLYLEQCVTLELEPALSITRAWRLVKFVEAGMLKLAPCTRCGGHFVVREGDLTRHYVCGLCNVPARAGRTRAARLAEAA
ncbi:MAG: flagellar transcriptional regulator FlhC [Burkholderiales bacterium]|nr:flagellar transcriptional regulator FlhC [Burkholderiales bacterium]MCE7877262.1 flagellar transcriptional regulator FlhC [Betaproteobacteria bacterium PRO3]